jgi:hypothetical protein
MGVTPMNARAEIFAALCVAAPAPRTDVDIAVMNATTGTLVTLPEGVNTVANERHPSITPDGTRLVFQRVSEGSSRVIIVDLITGSVGDVFSFSAEAFVIHSDPAITPDGTTVVTSAPPLVVDDILHLNITLSDVHSFPSGAFFPSSRQRFNLGGSSFVQKLATGGNLVAFVVQGLTESRLCLTRLGVGGTPSTTSVNEAFLGQPAMAAKSPQVVLYELRGTILLRPGDDFPLRSYPDCASPNCELVGL